MAQVKTEGRADVHLAEDVLEEVLAEVFEGFAAVDRFDVGDLHGEHFPMTVEKELREWNGAAWGNETELVVGAIEMPLWAGLILLCGKGRSLDEIGEGGSAGEKRIEYLFGVQFEGTVGFLLE